MPSTEATLAVHGERLGRHRDDLKRSFTRIEVLEDLHTQYALDRVTDQNRAEDMSAQLRSLKDTIETAIQGVGKVDDRVYDRLSSIETTVSKTQTEVGHINDRMNTFERNRFDIVKVLRWLATWRGTFFMIVISSMLIGAVFPDAREWISSLFSLAVKASP